MLRVDAWLKDMCAECQRDPVMEFEHQLRLIHARQIRDLLADPQRVDVPTFEREVWRFGAAIKFQGHTFRFYEDYRAVSQSVLDALLHAIETGEVALHGNYMFDQPINTLDPRSSDMEVKTALMREALRVLNDPALAPLEKVHRIMGVRGFGAGNATALVCFVCRGGFRSVIGGQA